MSALQLKYFILKPKGSTPHAKASRQAMRFYALEIMATEPELGRELTEWADRESVAAKAPEPVPGG